MAQHASGTTEGQNVSTLADSEIQESDDVFDVVDGFIDDLEDTVTDDEFTAKVQDWLDTVTALSMWDYSFNNQFSLLAQMGARDEDWTDDFSGYFSGFWQWQNDHNRHVKEGESGFKILAPEMGHKCPECGYGIGYHYKYDWMDCEHADTDPDEWDFDPEQEWSEGVLYFKTVSVFAFEQTKPVDDPDGDVFTLDDVKVDNIEETGEIDLQLLTDTANEYGISVSIETPDEYTGRPNSKGYTKLDGKIHVKEQDNTLDTFHVGIHELAHELLHERNNELSKSEREVEAECVAYAVSRHLGFEVNEFYVGRWNGERDELKGRLQRVRKTAADIISTIEENQ